MPGVMLIGALKNVGALFGRTRSVPDGEPLHSLHNREMLCTQEDFHLVCFSPLALAFFLLLRFYSGTHITANSAHMYKNTQSFSLFVAIAALSFSAAEVTTAAGHKVLEAESAISANAPAVLWRKPADTGSRNLFYGPGGKDHQPRGPFTFLKEDPDGTNPKFDVRDREGVTWKVKLGEEARPETVASRLVWAVGYSANEDYFLASLRVGDMPAHLHRGQNLIAPDGTFRNVRLKRKLEGEKKIAIWQWRRNAFTGTRELNGLRVMMALINNWDLKDVNNAIYEEKAVEGLGGPELIYDVSDLGASFGTTGRSWSRAKSKGNLRAYSHSSFISKVTPAYVDFKTPTRPALNHVFEFPEFVSRLRLRWIGRHIPREDARWIGHLLARLSPDQVRAAFRAAGYSAQEINGFTQVVEARIAELNQL